MGQIGVLATLSLIPEGLKTLSVLTSSLTWCRYPCQGSILHESTVRTLPLPNTGYVPMGCSDCSCHRMAMGAPQGLSGRRATATPQMRLPDRYLSAFSRPLWCILLGLLDGRLSP